ncbi:MAG: flagellar hook-basal body complex protein FliE [Ilumatobacteraceae bacterium]
MAIIPISPVIGGITPISIGSIQPGNRTGQVAGDDGGSGNSFGKVLADQLDNVAGAQAKADNLAVKAATGDLQSLQDYTIASTEAQLLTQLTVQVRNKALEAFNDIMRMQV